MKQTCHPFKFANALIPAIFMGLLIWGCAGKDDTEAIYELIRNGTALAEEKQLGDLMDLTTSEFVALPGGHDRRQAKGVLFAAFMHYGQFHIRYPRPQVDISDDGDGADATVHFLIVRQDQSIPGLKELYEDPGKWIETAGEKADLYRLKLELVKKGGDWLVGKAVLEGFKGTGF